MSLGYSTRIVALNKKASGRLLGVKLGRVCIEKDIPVTDVAKALKVSRQTVYNWFIGESTPTHHLVDAVLEFIETALDTP